ncbi:MAG: methyl-accepting chemotaxis protein, partial [bacterium]|nr:methyl-accepting chemotaxis protein [bacterium]
MLGDLRNTITVFDVTLKSLKESGSSPLTLDLNGDSRMLPVASEPAYSQLTEVEKLWSQFNSRVESVLADENVDDLQWIINNNMSLLNEMNTAVGMFQEQSEAKIDSLLTYQIIGVIVGIITMIFSIIIVNSIIKNIEKVKKFADDFGKGYLNIEIDIDSTDEIGEMTKDLNNSVKNLHGIMTGLSSTTGTLSSASE